MAVSSGTLSLNAVSTIKDLTLSGGTLGGTGSVTVGNSFTRAGGAFGAGLTGLNITQTSGDLSPENRQALFAHDNTHHALFMAYSAADCLAPDGSFDHARWAGFRKIFETHVVED